MSNSSTDHGSVSDGTGDAGRREPTARPPATSEADVVADDPLNAAEADEPAGVEPADGPQLLDIGRVSRPHALGGEVTVDLTTDRDERLAPGTVLATDRGEVVVASARPREHGRWLVRFRGVDTREQAEALRGMTLRAEPLDEPGTLWVHELVGCTVVSKDGVDRGTVVAVVANPASDLLELDDGALVPLTFIDGAIADRTVRLNEPDGLFEL